VLSLDGSSMPQTNPWWRTAAILKKSKKKSQYLSNGLADFDKIWHGDASRPYECRQPIKLQHFKNPRWPMAAILKIQ